MKFLTKYRNNQHFITIEFILLYRLLITTGFIKHIEKYVHLKAN